MATFDVAVGATGTGINTILSSLYASPAAQTALFNGSETETIDPIGPVTATWAIQAAPTVSFTPPTAEQWAAAYPTAKGPLPTGNVLTLVVSAATLGATYGGQTLSGTSWINVYATFTLTGGTLSVAAQAVAFDTTQMSKFDQAVVGNLLVPAILQFANSALSAIAIPQIPEVVGVTLQTPVAEIINGGLVIAAAMQSSAAVDLTGYTAPTDDLYALVGLTVINTVIASQVTDYAFNVEESSGNSDWNAQASIKGTVNSIVASISGTDLQAAATLSGLAGSAGVGGTGTGIVKTLLCPIGTAIDAIANPDNWDKLSASVSITYSPSPLTMTIGLAAVTENGTQSLQVTPGSLKDTTVTVSPTWSGDIIGTTLATACSGAVDLITAMSKGDLLDDILDPGNRHISVVDIPTMSVSIDGIKVSLTIADGAVATPFGSSYVSQSFSVTIG